MLYKQTCSVRICIRCKYEPGCSVSYAYVLHYETYQLFLWEITVFFLLFMITSLCACIAGCMSDIQTAHCQQRLSLWYPLCGGCSWESKAHYGVSEVMNWKLCWQTKPQKSRAGYRTVFLQVLTGGFHLERSSQNRHGVALWDQNLRRCITWWGTNTTRRGHVNVTFMQLKMWLWNPLHVVKNATIILPIDII